MNTILPAQDREFISAIRTGGQASQSAVIGIYRRYKVQVYDSVRHLVFRHPAGRAEPLDLTHDSFLILIEKIRAHQSIPGTIPGYWYGIASYLLRNYTRRQSKIILVEDDETGYGFEQVNPESLFMLNERRAMIEKLINCSDERCKTFLSMWFNHYSMREISDAMGLSGPAAARQVKHRCFCKIKTFLYNNNPPKK